MQTTRENRQGLIVLALILSSLSPQACAQQPDTIDNPAARPCVQPWNLVDSLGQTPCKILLDSMTQCTNNFLFTIPNVDSQPLSLYPVPDATAASEDEFHCKCTNVAYNLYQACAACQLGSDTDNISSRRTWFSNCLGQVDTRNMNVQTFWINQVYEPGFNVSAAMQAEITQEPPPAQPSLAGSLGASGDVSPVSFPESNNRGSKSNTAMIVGIVVGVVGFLAVLGIVAFFIRRKRRRKAPSAEFKKYAQAQAAMPLTHQTYSEPGSPRLSHRKSTGFSHQHGAPQRNDTGMTEDSEAPPSFTPGLFKDPIFEKGVALNLANTGYPSGGGRSASPVNYSPATPSTTHMNAEQQRLIQSRQASGSAAGNV